MNQLTDGYPPLEGWSKEEQGPLAESFPATIRINYLESCLFICESILCVYALDLHPFTDQAQIRLIQKIGPYQGDVDRKNAYQIQALMSGSNPFPLVFSHMLLP